MKPLITLTLSLMLSTLGFSQDKKTDTMPDYEGGIKSFYTYFTQNIRYPQPARAIGQEGILYVSFDVDSIRGIQNVQVINDRSYYFAEEIKRVLAGCPNHWKSKVAVAQVVLPVNFKFDKGNDATIAKPEEIPKGIMMSPVVVVGYGK